MREEGKEKERVVDKVREGRKGEREEGRKGGREEGSKVIVKRSLI